MKKKLVFVMTADGKSEGNRALAIHFASIKRYSHIFDEAMCVIHEFSSAYEGEASALSDRFINSSFANETTVVIRKIKDEDVPLFTYESEVLYRDVLCDKNNDGYLIFFAHAKGYTAYESSDYIKPYQLDAWITCLWFANNHFDDFAYSWLTQKRECACFCGTLYLNVGVINNYRDHYCGTFYWVNPSTFRTYFDHIEKPSNRWYAEMVPSKIPIGAIYFPTRYNDIDISKDIYWCIKDTLYNLKGIDAYREYLAYLNEETGLDIIDCTIENGGS